MTESELIRAAWREWCEAASYRGEIFASFDGNPPAWFIRAELGFSFDTGPSLAWNCETLARQNRSAIRQLGHAAPVKVTWPRDFDPKSRAGRVPTWRPRLTPALPAGPGAGKDDSAAFGWAEAQNLLQGLRARTAPLSSMPVAVAA